MEAAGWEQMTVGDEVREVVGPGNAAPFGFTLSRIRNQYRLCRVPTFSIVLPAFGIT